MRVKTFNQTDGNLYRYTEVGLEVTEEEKPDYVYIDRSNSGGDSGFDSDYAQLRKVQVEYFNAIQRSVRVDIIVDRNSVEAFLFGGMYAMSNLVFSNYTGVEIFTNNPDITVERLAISVLDKTVPFRE